MTTRRTMLAIASFALGIALVAVLVKLSRIDLRITLDQLGGVHKTAFVKLLVLNALLVLTSTEKWRSIDCTLRSSSDSVPSRATALTLTSAGLALGTFLPVQVSMSTARTLGTYLHGSGLKRGTAGTLYEQSFDLLTMAFLAVASGITKFYNGGGMMWTVSAVIMLTLALLTVGFPLRLIRHLAGMMAARTSSDGRIGSVVHNFAELLNSGLLGIGLARRLVLLSAARFVVVVLMSIQTAEAVGLYIPLWHMAAAMPFVGFASIIALTPGGLGINELTAAGALSVFGTSMSVGAQWSLTNRVLVSASYIALAACAAAILSLARIMVPTKREAVADR